jgi:AhpD family alkylhydroperoxidase
MNLKERKDLMEVMRESDDFFKKFGKLDDEAFMGNVVPKKFKELTMVAISIVSLCNECISYHIQESIKAGASKPEIIEYVKMGMMSRGSISYPYVRFAFKELKELKLV